MQLTHFEARAANAVPVPQPLKQELCDSSIVVEACSGTWLSTLELPHLAPSTLSVLQLRTQEFCDSGTVAESIDKGLFMMPETGESKMVSQQQQAGMREGVKWWVSSYGLEG